MTTCPGDERIKIDRRAFGVCVLFLWVMLVLPSSLKAFNSFEEESDLNSTRLAPKTAGSDSVGVAGRQPVELRLDSALKAPQEGQPISEEEWRRLLEENGIDGSSFPPDGRRGQFYFDEPSSEGSLWVVLVVFAVIIILIVRAFRSTLASDKNSSHRYMTLDELEKSRESQGRDGATNGYKCDNCGAGLPEGADVSPSGDFKCVYCNTWFNIHQ